MQIFLAKTVQDYEDAKRLFQAYANSLGFDLGFQEFSKELEQVDVIYKYPEGGIFLIKKNGVSIGCVGVRTFSEGIGELKRMYIQEEARGLKLGKQLLEAALRYSKSIGHKAIRLDTMPEMQAAIKLYRAAGFREIAPYRPNPFKEALFFELVF
jgi:ribosomal protein S18 acetylase RimI-like enzyme